MQRAIARFGFRAYDWLCGLGLCCGEQYACDCCDDSGFVQLAKTLEMPASKLLIPLSYAAIMGGTLTLIGNSTNLLVDGTERANVLASFTIFEVTPLSVILVI